MMVSEEALRYKPNGVTVFQVPCPTIFSNGRLQTCLRLKLSSACFSSNPQKRKILIAVAVGSVLLVKCCAP